MADPICVCGAAHDAEQKFCNDCGVSLAPQPDGFCSKCGMKVVGSAKFCGGCGLRFVPLAPSPVSFSNAPTGLSFALGVPGMTSQQTPQFAAVDDYYRDEFTRIAASNEAYKGKWNWAAFFFGAIWALTKGLWVPALIALVLSIITGGVAGFVYWFIFGARGNYMYYCKVVKQKDIPV